MSLARMITAALLRGLGMLVAVLVAEPATWLVERIADAAACVEKAR